MLDELNVSLVQTEPHLPESCHMQHQTCGTVSQFKPFIGIHLYFTISQLMLSDEGNCRNTAFSWSHVLTDQVP